MQNALSTNKFTKSKGHCYDYVIILHVRKMCYLSIYSPSNFILSSRRANGKHPAKQEKANVASVHKKGDKKY